MPSNENDKYEKELFDKLKERFEGHAESEYRDDVSPKKEFKKRKTRILIKSLIDEDEKEMEGKLSSDPE